MTRLTLALLLAACTASHPTPDASTAIPPDPYRWLERTDAPRTIDWVRRRDAAARAHLAGLPGRAALRLEIAAVSATARALTPSRAGGTSFFLRGDASATTLSLWVAERGREPRVLVAGQELAGLSLGTSMWPSPDGRRVAYAVGPPSARTCEVRVRDRELGADLPVKLTGVRCAAPMVAWTRGGDGLAFARAESGELRMRRIDQDAAERVLLASPGGEVTGLWARSLASELVAAVTRGSSTQVLRVTEDGRVSVAARAGEGRFEYAGDDGRDLLLVTTRVAPRGRVVRVGPGGDWHPLVAEDPAAVIESWSGGGKMAAVAGGHLYLVVRVGTVARIRQVDVRTGRHRDVDLPVIGAIWSGLQTGDGDELYFTLTGFADPGTVYRIRGGDGRIEPVERAGLPYDPDEVVTEAHLYRSAAGLDVPVLVARHRDTRADGRRPVLLYGYGWGGWIAGPWFRPHIHAWLSRGGVFALPALRGGGELGEKWQRDGSRRNRQNAVDDYIAAARWLVEAGWTSPGRIVAEGQSAGGSLVAAAVVQAPHRFGALLLAHPVVDMLHYERDPAARRWRSEFGTVADPADRRALLGWSPLHRLRRGACYPATLVMPGEVDPVAAPWHGSKAAAALADAQGCDRPILLRVAWGAGHAYGANAADTADSYADQLAFALAATR